MPRAHDRPSTRSLSLRVSLAAACVALPLGVAGAADRPCGTVDAHREPAETTEYTRDSQGRVLSATRRVDGVVQHTTTTTYDADKRVRTLDRGADGVPDQRWIDTWAAGRLHTSCFEMTASGHCSDLTTYTWSVQPIVVSEATDTRDDAGGLGLVEPFTGTVVAATRQNIGSRWTVTSTYDAHGRKVRELYEGPGGPRTTTREWDDQGRLVREVERPDDGITGGVTTHRWLDDTRRAGWERVSQGKVLQRVELTWEGSRLVRSVRYNNHGNVAADLQYVYDCAPDPG